MFKDINPLIAAASAAVLILTPLQAMAQSAPEPATVTATATAPAVPDPDWIPAERADTDAAQGGWVWVVAAGAAGVVIKMCGGTRIDGCARGVVGAFNTVSAARAFACRRYRRFC